MEKGSAKIKFYIPHLFSIWTIFLSAVDFRGGAFLRGLLPHFLRCQVWAFALLCVSAVALNQAFLFSSVVINDIDTKYMLQRF